MENHVGICAACGGAIKHKTVAAFQTVQRSYSDLRSKDSAQQSSATRTQGSEDRTLYEHAESFVMAPSEAINLDNKDNLVRMEQVMVTDGKK